jgi:Tripartite tricarboxylate transporter TctB family
VTPRSARRDRWSAAGLALLALGYLAAGRRYPLDTLATPGPGIFPLAAGLALLALALWQFLAARGAAVTEPAARAVPTASPVLPPSAARVLVTMSLVLALYAAALPVAGFVPSSATLVFVAARLMGLDGWWRPAALALGVTGASRVLFGSWLGVPLP